MTDLHLSVIAPCYNEEGNVKLLCKRISEALERSNTSFEIVLVDDGSTDETWRECSHLSEELRPNVLAIKHQTNRGISAAWLTGLVSASGSFVCLIDSDLQNPPEAIPLLLQTALAKNVDLVRAIRIPTSREGVYRVVMSKGLNLVLNACFRMKSRDNKSGFVLGPREEVLKIVSHRRHYRHFQTFLGVSANFHDIKVVEVETPFYPRSSGSSFLRGRTIRTIVSVICDIREARREFTKK